MGLQGRLEDLALSDIVQIIYLSKKSGVLNIKDAKSDGNIFFKNGLIIAAESSNITTKLVDMLLETNKINSEEYRLAVEIHKKEVSKTIEEILLEISAIDNIALDRAITNHLILIIKEFYSWKHGTFKFNPGISPELESSMETGRVFIYKDGLKPHRILAREKQTRDKDSNEILPDPQKKLQDAGFTLPMRNELEKVQLEVESELNQMANKSQNKIPIPESEIHTDLTQMAPEQKKSSRIVILVDDEAIMRNLINQHLEEIGFQVVSVQSVIDAIVTAKKMMIRREIPIIVTDLLMPQTDHKGFLGGLELLKAVREDYPEIPIIMMTDQIDPEIRYQCFKYGVRNYLFKPDRNQNSYEAFTADMRMFTSEIGFCIKNTFRDLDHIGKVVIAAPESEEFDLEFGKIIKTSKSDMKDKFQSISEIERFKHIFYELKNLREASEIILLILRYASECLERTIFFLVKDDHLYGLGGFGVTTKGVPITHCMHQFHISLLNDTPFKKVFDSKNTFMHKINDHSMDELLFKFIGPPVNREFILIPVFNQDDVMAMLYGDNAQIENPIQNTDSLEIFINQAEIAMENAFLQRRLKSSKK
ncbi:MAG: hypothetical protein A2161_15295 [Candidatus Schekmanbacteria bacterium RBG_13_48_7]|uniref:Response regulatory domain-containing protein n=1 Tax=Candidatus Schekmanbacteria bacterium RBG_13_48_7 TaxID=1817878 RepID=A0A1F7RPB1_9BACT|nr:MAG: hypothetical protein A2161_15295 [Candidatus Schekmanbacteria bacterium RBG_13_48_7]